jgi:glycerol uptake operon antiterminator
MEEPKLAGIIAAVENIRQFKRFIESPYKICVIMNIHISMLDTIFKTAKENEKLVLVHIDLIHGLANDEYGTEYICQKYKPYGIISTKNSVLSACKRLKTTAIQRVFLIDSAALTKSVESVKRNSPDYVEILPAMCTALIPMIKDHINKPMIAGGLIPSKEEAEKIIKDGMAAVTINMSRL